MVMGQKDINTKMNIKRNLSVRQVSRVLLRTLVTLMIFSYAFKSLWYWEKRNKEMEYLYIYIYIQQLKLNEVILLLIGLISISVMEWFPNASWILQNWLQAELESALSKLIQHFFNGMYEAISYPIDGSVSIHFSSKWEPTHLFSKIIYVSIITR